MGQRKIGDFDKALTDLLRHDVAMADMALRKMLANGSVRGSVLVSAANGLGDDSFEGLVSALLVTGDPAFDDARKILSSRAKRFFASMANKTLASKKPSLEELIGRSGR